MLLKTVSLSMHIWDEASVCLDPYLRQGNMIQDSGILVSEPTTVEALLLLDNIVDFMHLIDYNLNS